MLQLRSSPSDLFRLGQFLRHAEGGLVAVRIPMRGRANSLNLSVATGIMIYAATA
jgi:tRNA(Leu) C34 or U34 (ribose-2'-O)-methylase TrmL